MRDEKCGYEPAVETFLLGQMTFDAAMSLTQRLVFESGGRSDGQISVLLCEHPPIITVGRLGSRADVRLSPRALESRQLEVRWVNRGGGTLLHAPGQLAVYPIVPLAWHRWTVGEYLRRLGTGILNTLAELGVTTIVRADEQGIWARSGQLVSFGVAVKNWTTYYGAYLNVDPALRLLRAVQSDADHLPISSLAAERRQPVKMATVRATIVRHLATALDCERYHLYTGHPLAAEVTKRPSRTRA